MPRRESAHPGRFQDGVEFAGADYRIDFRDALA